MRKDAKLLLGVCVALVLFSVTRFLLTVIQFGLNDFWQVGLMLSILFYFVYDASRKRNLSLTDLRLCLPKRNHSLLFVVLLLPFFWRATALVFPGKWVSQPWDAAYWQTIFLPALLHSGFGSGFGEELLFRGYLMKHTETLYGKRKAILVTSLAFGLMHLGNGNFISIVDILWTVFYAGMLGMIFALLTYSTGSLLYPMIVHAVCNLFNVFANASLVGEGQARFLYVLHLTNAPSWAIHWITMIGPVIVLTLFAAFLTWYDAKHPTKESALKNSL